MTQNTTKVFDINFKELIMSEPTLKKRNSTRMLVDSVGETKQIKILGGNPR